MKSSVPNSPACCRAGRCEKWSQHENEGFARHAPADAVQKEKQHLVKTCSRGWQTCPSFLGLAMPTPLLRGNTARGSDDRKCHPSQLRALLLRAAGEAKAPVLPRWSTTAVAPWRLVNPARQPGTLAHEIAIRTQAAGLPNPPRPGPGSLCSAQNSQRGSQRPLASPPAKLRRPGAAKADGSRTAARSTGDAYANCGLPIAAPRATRCQAERRARSRVAPRPKARSRSA